MLYLSKCPVWRTRILLSTTKSEFWDGIDSGVITALNMHHTSVGRNMLQSADNWPNLNMSRDKQWIKRQLNDDYYRVSPAAGVNTNSHDMGIWLYACWENTSMSSRRNGAVTAPGANTRELTENWGKILDNALWLGWRIIM